MRAGSGLEVARVAPANEEGVGGRSSCGRRRSVTARWLRGVLAALTILGCGAFGSERAAALEIERTYEISEADLTARLQSLRAVYKRVWVDIRSEARTFAGRTYGGFITIHAATDEDRNGDGKLEEHYCRWDTVLEEDLYKAQGLYFDPLLVATVHADCWPHDWAVIFKAIGDWTATEVQPRFNGFNGLPDPASIANVSARGHYFPQRLILIMRLRTIQLAPLPPLPSVPSLPLDKLIRKP